MTTDIRTATAADHSPVVGALARAFLVDPVFRFVYPDDTRRREVLPAFFGLVAPTVCRFRASSVAGDGIGAALWVPPGQRPVEDDGEAFGAALTALAPEAGERLGAVGQVMEEAHPGEAHWYLNLLGVVPEQQGRGVGTALLRPGLDRCDAEGVPAYLEATSAHNRRLYERHGFVATDELRIPGGPSMWAMWRPSCP